MIVYPENWKTIGQPILLSHIETTIKNTIKKLNIRTLALSGGVDSSLLLFYMAETFDPRDIECYTIVESSDHPDYRYSSMITKLLKISHHKIWQCSVSDQLPEDLPGDAIVRRFFQLLSLEGVPQIIAGDGIDEFTCGYYDHQKNPTEIMYFKYLRRLYPDHLLPLNKASGDIKVYLPYLSPQSIALLSQIPMSEKVNVDYRKLIIRSLAQGKIPDEIIDRHKYGFCDAMTIKGDKI